jgi:branched-chain amino acid transport system permease protein
MSDLRAAPHQRGRRRTIYALVALGYTMVYGVLKLINFAHGDVMMVGTFLGLRGGPEAGLRAPVLALGRAAHLPRGDGGCAVLGFVIERFAYRPLRDKPRLTALITAIGISFTLSYGFQLTSGRCPGRAAAFPEVIAPREWLISATGRWSSGTGRSSAWRSPSV